MEQEPFFECPDCGRRSYNRMDIERRYCGACHEFKEAPDEARQPQAEQATPRSQAFSRRFFVFGVAATVGSLFVPRKRIWGAPEEPREWLVTSEDQWFNTPKRSRLVFHGTRSAAQRELSLLRRRARDYYAEARRPRYCRNGTTGRFQLSTSTQAVFRWQLSDRQRIRVPDPIHILRARGWRFRSEIPNPDPG